MPRRQCKLCPWKTSSDPNLIPRGYSEEQHRNLARTIAEPGSIAGLAKPLRVMACHDSPTDAPFACVGWLHNQFNEGNNIALRMAVAFKRISADYELDGPQHERFEDTLPQRKNPSVGVGVKRSRQS
jgi:hypothetical protein